MLNFLLILLIGFALYVMLSDDTSDYRVLPEDADYMPDKPDTKGGKYSGTTRCSSYVCGGGLTHVKDAELMTCSYDKPIEGPGFISPCNDYVCCGKPTGPRPSVQKYLTTLVKGKDGFMYDPVQVPATGSKIVPVIPESAAGGGSGGTGIGPGPNPVVMPGTEAHHTSQFKTCGECTRRGFTWQTNTCTRNCDMQDTSCIKETMKCPSK